MVETIQKYTRVAKKGNKFTYSTIHVIITNCYSDFENSFVLTERLGDHYAIKCELQFKVELPPKFEKYIFAINAIITLRPFRLIWQIVILHP